MPAGQQLFVFRPPFRRVRRGGVRGLVLAVVAVTTAATYAQHAPQGMPGEAHPNFDIRTAKQDDRFPNKEAAANYMSIFAPVSAPAGDLAVERVAGVAALEASFRGIRVENHAALGTTEIVSAAPGTGFLTPPSGDRVGALRAFLAGHAGAYGLSAAQVGELEVVADYMNPAGNMGWVELQQKFNGIPVFQGSVRGGFTAKGELVRTTGILASGIDASALSATPSVTGARAVALAAASVGWSVEESALAQKSVDGAKITFDRASMADAAKAWPVYFQLAPGVARLAWATEVWGDPDAFFTVVDAETGTLLFRKNMTAYQTQSATYNVYPSDSPAPSSPTSAVPGANFQVPVVPRSQFTLIGNEGPNTFNNLGWMTDGTAVTDGNNVEAGMDLAAPNGVDAPVPGPGRLFDFAYNPAPGNPAPGDAPSLAAYRNGEAVNMFYWVNRYHDATYLLGFTEQAFNFQNSNFGRGGLGADRISAEAQDISGNNNANFATPADGGRGRMQMFVWTAGATQDRSGGLDADIMLHELSHGLSNRLHGNATGLNTNMADGLGEGWSDFYARSLLSTADENVNGIYTIGGWATHLLAAGFTDNYYYGIRRFPYAPRAVVGPNGRPHSPLTFADIDSTQANLTDGAYPRGPVGVATVDQVHNIGEVWAGMLWEVRARVIARRGWNPGNQLVLQWVTDGMKLDPVGPTMIQARDAILAAATASGATADDIADIWAGFATRGLGVFAQVTNAGTGANNTRVIESFLSPGDSTPTFSINDVSLAEGNAGTRMLAFTVNLANPSIGESRITYATADGTATSPETTFTRVGTITVNDNAAATPYPANLAVAGLSGTIQSLAVRLDGVTHTFPGDLEVVLVGPGGQRVNLWSDAGASVDLSNAAITFRDGFPPLAGDNLTPGGTYAPTDATPFGESLPAPAPAAPYSATLSTFNGLDPNGTWSLYVADDAGVDAGSISSFTLLFSTTSNPGDYLPTSGQLIFPPGTTSVPVNVTVNGDTAIEATETFFVNLSAPVNAVIGGAQGVGTILNDDGLSLPTAANDVYGTSVNVPITQSVPGVLANDNAGGAGAMTAALVSGPAHGSLTLNANGGFSYAPNLNFFGADSFTYRAETLAGFSNVATVGLTVANLTTAQAPTELYVSSVVGNVVTFRWNPPALGPAPTQYVLEGGVPALPLLASLPTGSASPIFTVAVPNGSWIARVHTLVGGEKSAASNEVAVHANVPVAPSAPANLLGLVNGSTLALAWKNTFMGGAPGGLILDVSGSLAGSILIGAGESFGFTGVPGGSYTLQLRARNGAGVSGSSNPVMVSFPGACSGAPAPPERFLVYRLGSRAHVIWEPAASGAAPTSYVVHVSGSFAGSFPTAARTVSSPIGPGSYTVSVSAVNACGASAPTAIQTLVVP
jgi:subtilisin-like proprotein convertase family protein